MFIQRKISTHPTLSVLENGAGLGRLEKPESMQVHVSTDHGGINVSWIVHKVQTTNEQKTIHNDD